MIKINVISNFSGGRSYFKNPNSYIEKKVKIINKKNKNFKNKIIFCTLLLSGSTEKKILKNKGIKIKQPMSCHFHFIIKRI